MCKEKLTPGAIERITIQYYSKFCCLDISRTEPGIHFVCSKERDSVLKGFGRSFTMYILVKDDLCVVSYSPRYKDYI